MDNPLSHFVVIVPVLLFLGFTHLNGVSLDDRGKYFCCITTQPTGNSRNTENVSLEVRLPDTTEEFDKLQFVHEEIKILQQPILPFKNVKAAIGEKVHLTCLAGCRHKLKYEWLKRGVRSDLIGKIFQNSCNLSAYTIKSSNFSI